jgi:hypothetical protein
MNKILFSFVMIVFLGAQAHAVTILKCAVKRVTADKGARVNLLQGSDDTLRANLIFGTTVSGTMYHVTEVRPGIYQGTIKGKKDFKIQLAVSDTPSENKYIRGYRATLEVTYPDLQESSGRGSFRSVGSDQFVCGEQINNFQD